MVAYRAKKEGHLTIYTPMGKAGILLLQVAIWVSFYVPVFAQQYGVELSAFTSTIHTSYFHYNGFENVVMKEGKHRIIHYHTGIYEAYEVAKKAKDEARSNGFENAQIVQSNPVTLTMNKEVEKPPTFDESRLFIKAFTVGNESVTIKKEDRQHLEEIVQLMNDNPSLKLRVINPSESPNALHQGRLKTISNFLLAKEIAPYRMRIMNTHHDFLTAIDQFVASSSTPNFDNNQILITLINLKEEIILNPTEPPSINELTTSNEELSHLIKAVAFLKWS